MITRIKSLFGPVLSVTLFGVAAWLLHHELRTFQFHELAGTIRSISSGRILAATGFTFLSYLVMTGYDLLALHYVGHPLPYRKTRLASFIGYAFSNNIGMSMLSGASVRYRLYSAWGLSTFEIAQVVAFCTLTFWLGFLSLGGIVFVLEPMALPAATHLSFAFVRVLGLVMLAVIFGLAVFAYTKKAPFKVRDFEFRVPSVRLMSLQIGVAVLDWILAGTVLYVLLGPLDVGSFFGFIQVYMLAQLLGLISQVPGGMGVFETALVLLLSARLPASVIIAHLVVYRLLYYWFPLVAAVFLLGSQELVRYRSGTLKLIEIFGRWVSPVLPQIVGIAVMVGGAILLFSSATPALEARLTLLRYILPLPLLEFSHFISSLAGMALILLGRGLQRRLDAAWVLTVVLLPMGMIASLFKGFDYEEAIILLVIEAGLLPCRKYFYRKSSLFSERYDAGWIAAILIMFGASVWFGLVAYRHVEYSHTLWWQFTFSGNASRFLRGTVGAFVLAILWFMIKLMRPVPFHPETTPEELEKAGAIVASSPDTAANLALLGDKSFVFSKNDNAFIMFGRENRCWISMGDPVGPVEEWPELVWRFREIADEYNAWTVFYEVGHENLYLYLDMGLSLIKIGEEARVPLPDFSMEGKHWKFMRNIYNKLEKEGCRFEIITPGQASARMDELKGISDAWLAEKKTREKSFSLGSFVPEYIRRFPVALVVCGDHILAFANMWQGAGLEELSMDLMRYRSGAPEGVMDYLIINMMFWGKQQGYKWFNFGMAPLSGLENRNLAPLWNRLGAFVFRYGENFYNFKGLRKYKQKFVPVWQPKYIASPGGIALPQVFAGLTVLISKGIKGVVSK